MTGSTFDSLPFQAIRERFELDHVKHRGEVTLIVRARERSSEKVFGIQRLVPELAGEKGSERRFAEQLSAASGLHHPHVLKIHAVARDEKSVYGVVEWPEGGTFAERLESQAPSDVELKRVAGAIGEALAFAHGKGVAHGRVVASNVVLAGDGTAKLTGFGLTGIEGDDGTLLLDSGTGGGLMLAQDPTPRADVFQLCRLLDQASAGRGATPRPQPPWLKRLLERGLARLESDRFAGGDDFLRALSDALKEDVPSSATPSSSRAGATPAGGDSSEFPWRPLEEQYRLEGEPMEGGMGSVTRAIEIATGRVVAIKRMHQAIAAGSEAMRRFHREASNIARLSHPNVLQLFQVARDRDGDYLVLQWAPSGSLADRLKKEGKLPLPEAIALVAKIGAALAYAHRKGAVHRDVKPHNILLSEEGEPLLADFGLARNVDDVTLTGSKAGAGSPYYMAPEQWTGSRQADARADQYALAKTLYHLATGQKPLAVDARQVPESIREPMMRALSEEPDARFATVDEFVRAISVAPKPPRPPLLPRLVVAVAIVGAVGFAVWQWKPTGGTTSHSTEPSKTPNQETMVPAPDESPAPVGQTVPPEWRGPIAAIAAEPRYGGMKLAPQKGLLPLRADPVTRLWEFQVVATGERPIWQGEGPLGVSAETAIVLVLLPGGEFTMGAQGASPKEPGYDAAAEAIEAPPHRVVLAPFFIGKHEVTQGQWQRIAGSNPSAIAAGQTVYGERIGLDHPVENVGFDEANAALARAGLALPTEAQWEYAARAGTTTRWSTGDVADSLVGYANLADQTAKQKAAADWGFVKAWSDLVDGACVHTKVHQFAPNPFGLHFVHGNVAEWCADPFGGYDLPADPGTGARHVEGATQRIARGGSFISTPEQCRCSNRATTPLDFKSNFVGLRAARAIDS